MFIVKKMRRKNTITTRIPKIKQNKLREKKTMETIGNMSWTVNINAIIELDIRHVRISDMDK